MITIEISEELYEYLRRQLQFGEDADAVISRLVGRTKGSAVTKVADGFEADLLAQVSLAFREEGKDADAFKRVVEWLWQQSTERFDDKSLFWSKVRDLGGRDLRYFGKTEAELKGVASRRQLENKFAQPQMIWMATHHATGRKQLVLREILARVFEIPREKARELAKAFGGK